MMNKIGTSFWLSAVASAMAWSSEAAAAPSETELARARSLGAEGVVALEKRDFEVARSRCDAAAQIIDAPPLRLCVARALKGLGRVASASDAYQAISSRKPQKADPESWESAVTEAAAERISLDPLVNTVSGEARERLAVAFLLLSDQQYAKALSAFDDIIAKEHATAALWGRTLCLKESGKVKAALEQLHAFDVAAGADAKFSDAVARSTLLRQELERLASAKLTVVIHPVAGLTLSIDGGPARPVSATEELKLDPGQHSIRAAAPGYRPLSDTVAIKGGEAASFDVELRSLPPLRLVGYISLGTGVAALGAAAFFASQAASSHDTLAANCSQALACGNPQWSTVDAYEQSRLLTMISGGVGVAALATAAVLFIAAPSASMPSAPSLGFGPGRLSLHGSF